MTSLPAQACLCRPPWCDTRAPPAVETAARPLLLQLFRMRSQNGRRPGPVAAVVTLSSEAHSLAPAELDLSSFAGAPIRLAGHSLRLVGQGSGATSVGSNGGAAALATDADLSIEGIAMGPGVSLWAKPGGERPVLRIVAAVCVRRGIRHAARYRYSGRATPADVAAGEPGRAAVDVNGGHLVIRDTASYKPIGGTLPYAISLNGGLASLTATSSGPQAPMQGPRGCNYRRRPLRHRQCGFYRDLQRQWKSGDIPVSFGAGDQRTVETSCSGSPCVAQCMAGAPQATLGKAWFASSGSCEANSVADGVVVITQSGALANASSLPTDWQCKFSVASIGPDPAPAFLRRPALHEPFVRRFLVSSARPRAIFEGAEYSSPLSRALAAAAQLPETILQASSRP
jgi:hypothetical protein